MRRYTLPGGTEVIEFDLRCAGGFGNPLHAPNACVEGEPCSICGLVWQKPTIKIGSE